MKEYNYERDSRHRDYLDAIEQRFFLYQPRGQTDFERITDRSSYYAASAGRPDRMPELSPLRVCFGCRHPWDEHVFWSYKDPLTGRELGCIRCRAHVYVRVDVDESVRERCQCTRSGP